MNINIIAIGKLTNDFQKLFDQYVKKINFYSAINVIELKESLEKNIDIKIKKETEDILKHIPKNSVTILCSITGSKKNSQEFSKLINSANITFVIGGSNGVHEPYFENKICFSDMTFPHQLFRVMLIEQIYRSFTIQNNIKYHK